MEYLIGLILGFATVAFAASVGLDRDRAFYPTVAIVVASYYALFAVMGASGRTLILEVLAASVFLLLAVLGFKTNPWFVAAAIAGHGVFDFVHHLLIENPGVPRWWPGFCLTIDVTIGGWVALRLMRRPGVLPTPDARK
ncbi:MAG: hypothetical protein LAO20_19060 [Acidobacteriia bacterium]|nr:hypothetical protein [Terriglobia bacterium]